MNITRLRKLHVATFSTERRHIGETVFDSSRYPAGRARLERLRTLLQHGVPLADFSHRWKQRISLLFLEKDKRPYD